jgi:putative membrane protein
MFVWAMLVLYAAARVCQIFADRLPTLLIVVLHVVPPALFALVHGASVYGKKGIAVFAALCLGIGSLAELVSLRTGFPFGHYYFTDVMGPKVFGLPVFLALAYLGIGYVSWILAMLILGGTRRAFALPLLAATIMVAWDLAMDPDWATLDRAWIWKDGGAYFGVPLSNYFGWALTAFLYYQAFAWYCRARPRKVAMRRQFWMPAILLYAVCALGNTLIVLLPMAPPTVADATGRQWETADILACSAAVSLLVMAPFAGIAWWRARALSA